DAPGSWWLSADSWPNFPTHTGDNSAGNGGNGYFAGSLIGKSHAAFEPLNVAQAGSHATADAYQTNIAYFDQSATQIAGIGGDGGNGNAALGGNVGAFGSVGPGVIATGDNSAGNGGDGYFVGAMVHAPVAVYAPINIAVAGYNSSAHADQTNHVVFGQSAFQMAGVGGDGGNGNAATGGDVSVSGTGHGPHQTIGGSGLASDHGAIGSMRSRAGITTPATAETDILMGASFTRPLRSTIRSTSRWRDTIPLPTPNRQTMWCSINPLFRWPASGVMAETAI